MATLAANVKRSFGTGYEPKFTDLDVIASDIIYEGAAVGESSSLGTWRPLAAGDVFGGFAVRKVDNSAGSASAKTVRVRQEGLVELTVAGGTPGIDDIGETVYASDDATFTLASTGNSAIGKIVRHISTTTFEVFFQATSLRSL